MWMLLFSLFTANAMPTNQFQSLTSSVEEARFGSDQLRILRSLPDNTILTTTQAITLLNEVSFASEQLQALELMAPFITNRTQQYQIIERFTFSGDKNKAEEILNRIEPNVSYQQNRDPNVSSIYEIDRKERVLLDKERELMELERRLKVKEQQLNQRSERLNSKRKYLERWEARLQSWENRLHRRADQERFGTYPYESRIDDRRRY